MRLQSAIFDMDGTLLDSMWVWRQIDVDFLGRRGFEVPLDYLEMITPMGYYRAAEYTIERFRLNEQPEDLVQEWHDMAAEAYEKKVELKPHAKEYLLELKINKSKELLTNSALTCQEIAFESGFEYPSHFNIAFKKKTGITPNQYRDLTQGRLQEIPDSIHL